jgi:hypothetical protein
LLGRGFAPVAAGLSFIAEAPFTFVSLHDAFLLQLADADRSACERIRSDRTIAPEPVRGDFS